MGDAEQDPGDRIDGDNQKNDKMFTLKKWNAVAMWSWDVECDTCAICRVQVMGKLRFGYVFVNFAPFFAQFFLPAVLSIPVTENFTLR
ncbi:RING-box protein 2 [Cyphomyrmex costatus]|uniref:RING-box protein 2 n=1 Tax=Cyphomyrmex costatus TaxID=456900 RepID=A0A195CZZ3_9HYME|nr:RING-box protein 2 [Cyphomyrmex costatus]